MADSSDSTVCPHCGRPIEIASPLNFGPVIFAPEASQTVETEIPVTHCVDDGLVRPMGSDGFILSASQNGNGEGHTNGHIEEPPAENEGHSGHRVFPDSDEFPSVPPEDSSEYDPLKHPVADPLLDVFAEAGSKVSETNTIPAEVERPAASTSMTDEVENRRISWPLVLLGSYSSAMTIAVAWLLWQSNGREVPSRETLPPRSIQAREILKPIANERRASIGKTLRVGSLEITPLSLKKEVIALEWPNMDGEWKTEDGPECLVLEFRVKNISKDETFAPLDPRAIRRPDQGVGDSFLEMDGEIVESYPLAVASEKRIVGQSFASLKPGESRKTIVVSDDSGARHFRTPGVWRVKLRVTPDQSVAIGIDVRPEDLQ